MLKSNCENGFNMGKSVKKLVSIVAVSMMIPMAFAKGGDQKQVDYHDSKIACMGHMSDKVAKREAQYHLSIVKYASKYGLNPNLIKAIVSVESCYDKNAVSSAGAQGLMQLMPATAEWLGVTDSLDSEQNLEAGTRYLAKLKKRYNDDNKLALAAYNAGPGNVKKYKGVPPFPETQAYVVKVQQRFQMYQMLSQLAFNATQY